MLPALGLMAVVLGLLLIDGWLAWRNRDAPRRKKI
jgi:hypothetical protein